MTTPVETFALWTLEKEARAMLSRLGRVRSFAVQETMVPAASLSVEAQAALEKFLAGGRRILRRRIVAFLRWLRTPEARNPALAHRRFIVLRLRFNIILSHFDIFNEALSQRSEAQNGIWLAGLDVASRDALDVPGLFDAPPVVCYLARGPGAAIRRARTRLPGGDANPVAIVRVPRERMVGSGIASSLFHEVGHQGAALLDLVSSLRADLRSAPHDRPWNLWRSWISEIVADLWSIARVGATSTAGLIGVVSLPAPFVFRIAPSDPHPSPYIRVKLSAAIGNALYPDPVWSRLTGMWQSFYDITRLAPDTQRIYAELDATMPAFIARLLAHRSQRLAGRPLGDTLKNPERSPARLAALHDAWIENPALMRAARPTTAFAVLGQARLDGRIEPEAEGDLVASLLRHWAWRATVDLGEVCAAARRNGNKQRLAT